MSQEFYDAVVYGKMDKVREMLAADPSVVHSRIKWDFTALHGVAGEDNLVMAKFLLDNGVDPNVTNDEGITPLHLAAYPKMVELLVRRGADINIRSKDGRTPLIVQSSEQYGYEPMEALLKLGADANASDKSGMTALSIAQLREENDKVDLLVKYGVQGPEVTPSAMQLLLPLT